MKRAKHFLTHTCCMPGFVADMFIATVLGIAIGSVIRAIL